jgi:hypothetical protein
MVVTTRAGEARGLARADARRHVTVVFVIVVTI